MNISELTFTVDRHGSVKLPAPVLEEMGLYPGDHVRVAYLTPDGVSNTFREFMLLSDPTGDAGPEEGRLLLPALLMDRAGIPSDADLQIVCLSGGILICQDAALRPEELRAVLELLHETEKLSAMLPDETHQALTELEHTINTIQKGAQYDE